MNERPSAQQGEIDGGFRIAAVSSMTGIPVPTIRMWERRYGVVTPARSAGNGRLYSQADVDRLALLRAAVAAGHAIGTVALLSSEDIRARLSEPTRRATVIEGPCRIWAAGAHLPRLLEHAWKERDDVTLAAALGPLADGGAESATVEGVCDVLVVEAPVLDGDGLRRLRLLRGRVRPRLVVVVHGFSTRAVLARLDGEGVIAIASPCDPAHLARLCLLGATAQVIPQGGIERWLLRPASPRRYDDAYLAALGQRPTTVRCECPNHIADLLMRLHAFEQYSLSCERESSQDAALHALLYSAAAQSRELIEHALGRLLEYEGVEGPPRSGG